MISIKPTISLLIILLTGCAGMPEQMQVKKPEVRVSSVNVSGLDFKKVNLNLQIEIHNPNFFSLQKIETDLTFFSESKVILKISNFSIPTIIPAFETATTVVPVEIMFANIFGLLPGLRENNQLDYLVKVDLRVPVPVIGVLQIPLTHNGHIPIPRTPEIKISGAGIDKLSLNQVTLFVDLGIKNTNAFDISSIVGNFKLGINSKSAGVSSITVPALEEGQTGSARIKLEFSPMNIGLSLFGTDSFGIDLNGKINWKPLFSGSEMLTNNISLKTNLPL